MVDSRRLRKATLDSRCKRLRSRLSRRKIADRLPSGALMPSAFADTMPKNAANAKPEQMMVPRVRIPLAPPRSLWVILSLAVDAPAEAQEFGRFPRPAVHLQMRAQVWNSYLTARFLYGRSPGPFGTHFAFRKYPRYLADRGQAPSLQFLLAGRDTSSKHISVAYQQVCHQNC